MSRNPWRILVWPADDGSIAMGRYLILLVEGGIYTDSDTAVSSLRAPEL